MNTISPTLLHVDPSRFGLKARSRKAGRRTLTVFSSLTLALTVVFAISSQRPILAEDEDSAQVVGDAAKEQLDQAKEEAAAQRERAREAREEAKRAREEALEQAREQRERTREQMALAKERVHQQMEDLKSQMELAQAGQVHVEESDTDLPDPPEPPEAPEPPDPFAPLGAAFEGIFGNTGGRTESPVVAVAKLDEAQIAQSQEDLQIMHRILTKAAGTDGERDHQAIASGIVLSTFPALRQARSLLLEDYGAVFLLRVKFPLVGTPPAKDAPKPEKKVDQTWEDTKREIYSGSGGSSRVFINKTVRKDNAPARFDSEQVGRMQRAVSLALKNGVNIRHLKDDDRILVVITGPKAGAEKGESTLTLQCRKSDANAFAKGELKEESFLKKVAARAY